MMTFLQGAALIAATLTVGLMAGLFFAYSCSVMPGLARSDDRTLVTAMQRINVAIVNGWFLVAFVGGLGFTLLAGVLLIAGERVAPLLWTAAGLVLYAATLGITARVNIPLNNALDAAGPADESTDLAGVRERFEAPWVRWNLIRTVTSVAALVCLLAALLTFP